MARYCINWATRIAQKYYSTKIIQLKRLPEKEFGYKLPLYKKDSD